eukprot:5025251-Pyramimonas_sp.AAC.1
MASLYSGGPCPETPCLPPGCTGFLGLGFLWKVSCGLASTVVPTASPFALRVMSFPCQSASFGQT